MRTADRAFERVRMSVGAASGLTALGLGVEIAGREPALTWLGRASLAAALVAWGLVWTWHTRLRSVMTHNNAAYATLFDGHPQPILLADDATLDIVAVN